MAHYLRFDYASPASPGGRHAQIWRLPVSTDPDALREELAKADPGTFVPVQVVMSDQLHEQTLFVRLQAWGSWMIHDLEEPDHPGA